MDLYIDHISPATNILGPGRRLCLWVEGCSMRCSFCMTPELQKRHEKSKVTVPILLHKIMDYTSGDNNYYNGLTISGGEPFEQAEALCQLLSSIHRKTSLDVMIYSGYTKLEILQGSAAMRQMLKLTDILIDGRYRNDLPDKKSWCGSDNQQAYLLTKRAKKYKDFFTDKPGQPRQLEVEMTLQGKLRLIGIPRRGELASLQAGLYTRGIDLIK